MSVSTLVKRASHNREVDHSREASQRLIDQVKGKIFYLKPDEDLVRIRGHLARRFDASEFLGTVSEINKNARFAINENAAKNGNIILRCLGDTWPVAILSGNLFLDCFAEVK